MKKLYLIVILTSIINISKADWEVFRLNQKSYYTYFSDSTVMSLYMDTIIQRPGYQVYFQNRKYYGYDHGSCYSTLAPPDQPYVNLNSPMSPPFDSLEIKGDSVIYYNFSTPVYFLPNAVIGQSWNFGTHVVTHVFDALRSFLGVTDSVRLFSIGSDTIILSKNYGFVKYPVFYTASSTSVDIEHLIGFSNQSGA